MFLTIDIFAIDEEHLLYRGKSFFNSQTQGNLKIIQDRQNAPFQGKLLLLEEHLIYTDYNQPHRRITIMM